MFSQAIATSAISGEKFEIFVDPDHALRFKKGETHEYEKAIAFDEIYRSIQIHNPAEIVFTYDYLPNSLSMNSSNTS